MKSVEQQMAALKKQRAKNMYIRLSKAEVDGNIT